MNTKTYEEIVAQLPGLNCGQCGYKSCESFAEKVQQSPASMALCIHLNGKHPVEESACASCGPCAVKTPSARTGKWQDSLGREFDFVLDSFPNEPGPREVILPHNPARTKELAIQAGDILIGRPMGMSCGCPITHCGVVIKVDQINGVMTWCVTGPLGPRTGRYKDIGYYTAEAYEGFVRAANTELKIGMRYWFMPHRCMLQWRHSGLVNFLNQRPEGLQIRVEGLMIG